MKYNNYSINYNIDGRTFCRCCHRSCDTIENYKTGEYEYTCKCGYHEKHVIPKTQGWYFSNRYVTFYDYPMWYKSKMIREYNSQKLSKLPQRPQRKGISFTQMLTALCKKCFRLFS